MRGLRLNVRGLRSRSVPVVSVNIKWNIYVIIQRAYSGDSNATKVFLIDNEVDLHLRGEW